MKAFVSFSLIAVLLLTCSFAVFAANSPEAGTQFDYDLKVNNDDYGTVKSDPAPDGAIKLTATAASGKLFTKWNITGSYEIVSGSLESKEITIKPLADGVVITAEFKKDPSAPGTGVMDLSIYVAAVFAIVCVTGALLVFKKALIA